MILINLPDTGQCRSKMILWSILFVIVFAASAYSEGEPLLTPCSVKDIDCLSKGTEKFLEKTAAGIPDYDIRAIDPFILPSLEFEVDSDMGLKFKFADLNVTGLKNEKISGFEMNTDAKSVLLQTKANIHIVGNILIKLTKDSKEFSGIYTADASVLNTARYTYAIKKDDKGVDHYEVGPETIECEVVNDPIVILDVPLQNVLSTDEAAKARLPEYTANAVTLRKKAICNIAKLGYANVVHNLRASAKILPKTSFFTDV